ncbi:MAG: thioredoxin [Ignavibacteriae bacterium HGW-Ignavibacteriae-3]|nr:MAG: thioredoxin [Ignavibacteriae bacterium HGW-Ignavibacteriae-3]
MQTDLFTLEDFSAFIKSNKAAAVYFSTPDCNVCKVLKPKLIELLAVEFPIIQFAYVNCEESKELAAQQNVFSVPTILFFFDGKEYIRKARFVNLQELEVELSRIYTMM